MGEVNSEAVCIPAIAPVGQPRIDIDRAQTSSASEATEVHVHIEQIEVTAIQESAATKKSRPAPRNQLPLSDYLARRRRS